MRDTDDFVPPLPPSVPRVRPSAFARWFGHSLLRLGGWRVDGTLPDVRKLVLIAAPHSSNWDGIWGMAAKMAMGIDVRALGKAQLFWWPLGPLLRRLGVIPVERSAPQGTVGEAVRLFQSHEKLWFGLTPEGTRKPVPRWKTGFWKIARAAEVPILPLYFHYPEKTIGIGPLFQPTADLDADVARLREWYRPWQGRHHGTP
ncbi:MAG: lysophospholipid acyltransferase family protein [Thermomonas sp.]